jgi:hypothetical protein
MVSSLKQCDAGLKSRSRQDGLLLEQALMTLALAAGDRTPNGD